MGSGTSKPLPDLPTNNYFCITFTSFDRLTVLYGGKYSQFEFFSLPLDMTCVNEDSDFRLRDRISVRES